MNQKEVIELLEQAGALIRDSHLVYTSGRHGSAYVNKDAIYPHTESTSRIAGLMAKSFAAQSVEVVVGPALGGIILSQWVAYHISKLMGREILGVYSEKNADNQFELRRGYDKLVKGKRALIVEDVITTGGSVRNCIEAVQAAGGIPIGISALCNRGKISANDLGIQKLESLVELDFQSWEADECPLCQKKVPINTNVGKGKDFLAQQS